jgi:hypothetical protein
MNQSITAEDVVKSLNRMLDADPKAISDIFLHRVACNENLANDPACVVQDHPDGYCQVGVLGIINGFFGFNEIGIGQIAMAVRDDGSFVEYFELSDAK